MTRLQSYAEGHWKAGDGAGVPLFNAVNGEAVAEINSSGLDFDGMLRYGRNTGGPALRKLTFHKRALLLKDLARYLLSRKEEFYEMSAWTGATRPDSWIDIEGGISTLFVYSSKGRRELPDAHVYMEGEPERISREGTFTGQHMCVPLEGVALHINAFNFPCWGMLEKLGPTLLAGMPAIVKPASVSGFLAHKMFETMIESEIFPAGSLQLIAGSAGNVLDCLTSQDVVTFTGSAATGLMLKSHSNILSNSIRFNMEADSLNCSILGPDVTPTDPEFKLFIKEVAREMTVKAGQKCTAIRRTFVPSDLVGEVVKALATRLDSIGLGDPSQKKVRMGPLAARAQVDEVAARVEQLRRSSEVVFGDPENFEVIGADADTGAFSPSLLLYCDDPANAIEPHEVEAFGPVNTVMPYADVASAVALAKMGKGSLVGSLFTYDDNVAREVVLGTAAYHGRILVLNRDCAAESTGHGSPLPHLVHGGPGRAGGGEEMGGIRGALHYMQRCAVQGSPTTLGSIGNRWLTGGRRTTDSIHPFRKEFDELVIGECHVTHRRTITETDIVNFACLSGDHFYAHMDEIAAQESLFEGRVAHGYLILGISAGLFVDPAPGPVLANYGLESLRFTEPVKIGDTIQARLTCRERTAKPPREDEIPQGIVTWDVEVINQDDTLVATYQILTLVRRAPGVQNQRPG